MADNLRDTKRLEYFSDAVFAIAATLLASELPIPHAGNLRPFDGALWPALAHHWPSYAGFAASFLFIGIAWANHHAIFRYIRRTDHNILILNLVFLMGIVLYGFATQLVIEHLGRSNERTAVMIYYGLLTLTALLYNVVWWYAVRKDFLIDDINETKVRGLTKEYVLGPLLHFAAFVIAIWSVSWSVVPIIALYIFFALPRRSEQDEEEEEETVGADNEDAD